MNALIIFLAQTKGEATIEILSLLLVAAIIGYVTAWLYYKSVFTRRIMKIESEKEELNSQVVNLNVHNNELVSKLHKKDTEIEHLVLEVNALKALHAESVQETNDMTLKNKRTERLLNEKEEALNLIAQRKYLLDYKSFGTATEEEKDDLKMISGIGPFIEERLHALDIFTFRQISKFTAQDIETINEAIEYFSGRIERDEWVAQATELVQGKDEKEKLLKKIRAKKSLIYYDRIGTAKKEEADDLTEISGIGGWINEKLNAIDIYTFRQIRNFNDEDIEIVTDAIEYFPGRIERDEWIQQARELIRIEISKSENLKRISVMKNRIYYDRLGVAHKHHANNLTLIKGISLWLEESLNLLDIYTFKQISNLTSEDIVILSDILEISPNRIHQDNWVAQAQKLAEEKIHQEIS